MTVRGEALRHLAQGKQSTAALLSDIRVDAMQAVRSASEQSREALQVVKTDASVQLADAKRDVPAFWSDITLGTRRALRTASRDGDTLVGTVLERAQWEALRAKQATEEALVGVGISARLLIREGATRAEALMREIAGQGPEKTLSRGFAIVRSDGGEPLTRAAHVVDNAEIEIQFQDGRVAANARKQK
jgi:exodeoxyribonuclease VII large subunit